MVKRSVINMNYPGGYEYAWIDHIRGGLQFGPGSSSPWLTTGGPLWTQNIDSEGWPAYSTATINKAASFGGIYIPDSTSFAGPYVIDGFGSGVISIAGGSWTIANAVGVSKSGNNLTVTDQGTGVRWYAELTYTGSRAVYGLNATTVDPLNTGKFLRRVRWYRLEDAARLASGKVFRLPWLQIYAEHAPHAIRFMNWFGGNSARICRHENRTLPTYAGPAGNYNYYAGPRYGETTGTNQFTVAAVSGTGASMQHGEICQTRITNSVVRVPAFTGGTVDKTVSAFNKTTRTATCTAHGFNSGDKIIHYISAGMTQLDRRICTITSVPDANTYVIDIDTSSFSNFTAGTVNQYVSLQVGSGSDRRAYPIVFQNGYTIASAFGAGYLTAGDYKTFYFDKTLYAAKDSDGTIIQGVWIFTGNGADQGHEGGIPVELCVTLINELNEISDETVGLWLNIPHWAMLSNDPDYNVSSNLAVKSVDIIENGANGYAALGSGVPCYIEFSNETWNTEGGFNQSQYLMRRGYQHWNGANTSQTDYVSFACLRSYLCMKDIQTAFPRASYPRLSYILGLWGSQGIGVGGHNYQRVHGNTATATDVDNPTAAEPMSNHDIAVYAAYVENDDSNATYSLATCETAWTAASGAVAKEAVCATYVQGIKTFGGTQTIDNYYDTLLPAYATHLGSMGKQTGMYEGGWNRAISGTTAQQNFLKAVKRSRAWAIALKDGLNKYDTTANAAFPADYYAFDTPLRWGHAENDMYSGTTEGGGLDLAWTMLGLRNRGLRQMSLRHNT